MNKNRESRKFRLNKQSRSFTNHFRLQVEKAAESFRQHRDDLHEITTDTGPYFGLTVPPVVERRERPRDVLERYRPGGTSHLLTSADRFFEIAGRPCFLTEGEADGY